MDERIRDNEVLAIGKHIISVYALRPVACDKEPWRITHNNKYNQNFKTWKREENYIKIPKNMSVEEQVKFLREQNGEGEAKVEKDDKESKAVEEPKEPEPAKSEEKPEETVEKSSFNLKDVVKQEKVEDAPKN